MADHTATAGVTQQRGDGSPGSRTALIFWSITFEVERSHTAVHYRVHAPTQCGITRATTRGCLCLIFTAITLTRTKTRGGGPGCR